MTKPEFDQLPALLRRRHLLSCGFTDEGIRSLRYVLKPGELTVPPGRVGAVIVEGLAELRGDAKYRYRKADVAKLCGW